MTHFRSVNHVARQVASSHRPQTRSVFLIGKTDLRQLRSVVVTWDATSCRHGTDIEMLYGLPSSRPAFRCNWKLAECLRNRRNDYGSESHRFYSVHFDVCDYDREAELEDLRDLGRRDRLHAGRDSPAESAVHPVGHQLECPYDDRRHDARRLVLHRIEDAEPAGGHHPR